VEDKVDGACNTYGGNISYDVNVVTDGENVGMLKCR